MPTLSLLVILTAAAADDGAAPGTYTRTAIDIGVVVSDVERSIRFYRDDLGLSPAKPPFFEVPGDLCRQAGINDGKDIRVAVFLIGGGPEATRLKLIGSPDARKGTAGLLGEVLGVRYLTLHVKDLGAVVERLKARSIPLVAKCPVALPGGAGIAFVKDPDGNLVEFVGPLAVPKAPAAGPAADLKPLFDGKSLEGWKPMKSAVWKVADGCIVGEQGENSSGGWLVSGKAYGDFDLRFKFRMTKGGNSGVGLRFSIDGDVAPAKTGYECQISETDPKFQTGAIFGLKNSPSGLYTEGEWCEGRILAIGSRITTWFGGKEGVAVEDGRSARGYIGLQVHGSALYKGMKVEFKDIGIQEK